MRFLGLAALALAGLTTPAFAQAPGEGSAVPARPCDRECLIGFLKDHMAALKAGDASALPLAADIRFTENNVLLPVGKGLWNTVTAVDEIGLETADPWTGNAAWFGSVRENGEPAIYAVRIHVEDGLIDEIESVVHRKTALPAPFGDVEQMVHDPEFYEILPQEERSTRERLHAIADSYFDTVEVNDGQVFAPFADDCARLENGISTTAAAPGDGGGNAASIMAGCENQFKLGIYRINKRIRRDIFIIDEERGVAVARGFFDHANEFDRYLLTNGQEMKTALKWPNSITLLEAFRIRNAEIQRIEAVFTYVPYFMHNPFWGPDASPPEYAAKPDLCDRECLANNARQLVQGMIGNQWRGLNWADKVGYAENSVGIRVSEGIWATVTAVDEDPLVVADDETGKAVWIGRIEEHGQPAWAAITMTGDGDRIGAVDALIRRKEYGLPYADPVSANDYGVLPAASRTSRKEMLAGAAQFYAAVNDRGAAPSIFGSDCRWHVNGQDVAACAAPFGGEGLAAIEHVRDRKLLAMDESRGLAVFRTFEDLPARNGAGYPLTYQVVELFHFTDGKVERIEAFTSELPYGMVPH
ncbi:hypothetical protein FHS61_001461 [Altererythrobacter atlanticus]|uniref:DUF8021 domain-containing protein n=1 Tax=Croceibacterium atlanticum TaxID=1267766 RepID=A0A0F7KY48_9SPHN|nr:hypothetical protein [Croceibacterium atlanticum]AKH44142.1 hypothetical protein WYH_03123 [Croceibacterium atlanticum]MBB5732452.1 hypothetical protein [Croceibacterium atlanticum]